jgi:hypothetical protein
VSQPSTAKHPPGMHLSTTAFGGRYVLGNNTFATLATLLVIAATALAAIIQLRHARSSNHIAALNELRETQETPHFQAGQQSALTELRRYGDLPATARRRSLGNFEYLATLAQDWITAHPNGAYPAGRRRIPLKDEWLDGDKQYAASLVPA